MSASEPERRCRRVLIFHGYLLRGTGSNVYTASLARALARQGSDVHLLCQDRGAAALDWVDAVGAWEDGRLAVRRTGRSAGEGSVTAYLPDIGGLLPVYVKDAYEGFEVKAFPELGEDELQRYLDANVAAARDVAARAGGVDAALANHLVMGPAILARAAVAPYAVKIHGSALEYAVKRDPRFVPYAEEGLRAASCVLVGSRHTAESLWAALPSLPSLREKTRLGPPGVDTEQFRPLEPGSAEPPPRLLPRDDPQTGAWGRDRERAGSAVERFLQGSPRVIYVGKLIVSKGVDLLLAAWPLAREACPGARLLIAGFGEYEQGLLRLLAALEAGDLEGAREVARRGWALEGGEAKPLPILSAFLAGPPAGYAEAARAAAGSVAFSGRLEHAEVARVLPFADALVMPSTFPEAFGMVPVEAAACGALPVAAAHSGMREVARQLAASLPPSSAELVSFPLDENAVEAIAARLREWFALPEAERGKTRRALVETARRLWSWEGVAAAVTAAAAGRVERLPPP